MAHGGGHIVPNGEGEPVWLTPHHRDSQPEGERERNGACGQNASIYHNETTCAATRRVLWAQSVHSAFAVVALLQTPLGQLTVLPRPSC